MSSDESETRTRILKETMRLMEQQRGQDVRISDIARAAGVSRQAVYLHFNNRTELLVATVRYADEVYELDKRLQPLQAATSGISSLRTYLEFWAGYIPSIYGLAKALRETRATDSAAAAAWDDRMRALRWGCQSIVDCLVREGDLRPELDPEEVVDLLWSLLGIEIWENLTIDCGWSTSQYVSWISELALRSFVREDRQSGH
jgi:AcrR family transcriptional regulator